MISNDFVTGWPSTPAYVTKWSGGCLRDESSGVGGFCLLENADLDLTVTSTTATTIYGVSGSTTTVQNMTNRAMQIYRMSAADFTTFEGAWSSQAALDSAVGQDGRCYRNSIASTLVTTGTNYFELPVCTQSGNKWTC